MSKKPFYFSLYVAIKGLMYLILKERNIKLHLLVAILFLGTSYYWNRSLEELIIIAFGFSVVITIEMVNTVFEEVVNFISPDYHKKAGLIKDMAAGTVLFISGCNSFFSLLKIFIL